MCDLQPTERVHPEILPDPEVLHLPISNVGEKPDEPGLHG